MDSIISSPRLKLTSITSAERGSKEFEWLHELRSNEQLTFWSISRVSKTLEDTEKNIKNYIIDKNPQGVSKYRIAYAVHEIVNATTDSTQETLGAAEQTERLIGLITLTPVGADRLVLPEHLTLPAAASATTLTSELAYGFLPNAWGKGYATESVNAVIEACKAAPSFWTPFSKVYVRVLVNSENAASNRVMTKTGFTERGTYEWSGKAIFVGGRWREQDSLRIYGMHLLQ